MASLGLHEILGHREWLLVGDALTDFDSDPKPTVIHIRGEKIQAVHGKGDVVGLERLPVFESQDTILPGLVDSHVHINEPGRTDWEGFQTATQAAAAGGVTTLVDMPLNCDPVTTTGDALTKKIGFAERQLFVDCGFFGGVVPGNTDELRRMRDGGVFGFKCFLTHSGIDDFPNVTRTDLEESMPTLKELDVPLLVHAELDQDEVPAGVSSSAYKDFLGSRPKIMEEAAIELMVEMSREVGSRVHIVHLSASSALPLIEKARSDYKLPFTVETCPHYLTLAAEEIADGQVQFKCTPPIREEANQAELWQALEAGLIDFVVSDHSPCTVDLKKQGGADFYAAWGGISSLQLTLPIVWTKAQARGNSLGRTVKWLSQGPAEWLGMSNKGSIVAGKDADFVFFNSTTSTKVDANGLRFKNLHSPYLTKELKGATTGTILRGKPVFDGELFYGPRGQVLSGV